METRPNNLTEFKAEALEACLSQIEAGASLEEALKPYGTLADALRPLVEVALANRAYAASLAAPKLSMTRSRARFLNAAQTQAERSNRSWFAGIAFPPLARAVVAFILVLLVGSFSTAVVSAQALPGDLLYPVKLAGEQTRLFLAGGPLNRLRLEKSFDERRAEEILELLKRERSEVVRLGGEVTMIQPGEWVVRDTVVLISDSTRLEHEIEVGFYVEVTGQLNGDGSLQAQTIRARQITFSGTVDETSHGEWIVDGLSVGVTVRTLWVGSPEIGSRVRVIAFVLADGSLQAYQIEIEDGTDAVVTWTSEPTASPTFTATPAVSTPEVKKSIEAPESTSEDEKSETPEPEDEREDEKDEEDRDKESDSDRDRSEDDSSGKSPTNTPKPDESDKSDESDD